MKLTGEKINMIWYIFRCYLYISRYLFLLLYIVINNTIFRWILPENICRLNDKAAATLRYGCVESVTAWHVKALTSICDLYCLITFVKEQPERWYGKWHNSLISDDKIQVKCNSNIICKWNKYEKLFYHFRHNIMSVS